VIDAHDGNILYNQNKYYWYAASYGTCKEPSGDTGCNPVSPGACGFQYNHNVSVWTSTDLSHWTYGGVVFQATQISPPSIMFCPKAIYNRATQTFVLWVNPVRDGFRTSYYAIAVSKNPLGPFKLVSANVSTLAFPNVGDFGLLVDSKDNAYVIYTSFITGGGPMGDHMMSIEQLTPDYQATLGKTKNSGGFGASGVEAPAFFYDPKSSLYIAVFGHTCCYCKGGAPVAAYVSPNPLGPYKQMPLGTIDSISAQQTDIFSFLEDDSGTVKFMWVGDMWQQSPNGKKSDDPTYWAMLDIVDGNITKFSFVNQFDVTVCY